MLKTKLQRMKGGKQMRRRLSSYEQETIINFNKAENTAFIFTYDKSWQQHLEKKLGLKPTMDNGFGGKEYEIDKRRIRPPRAPVKLSAEIRAKLANRLRQSHDFPSQNTKAQRKPAKKNKTGIIYH
jgi:hypothetical protein